MAERDDDLNREANPFAGTRERVERGGIGSESEARENRFRTGTRSGGRFGSDRFGGGDRLGGGDRFGGGFGGGRFDPGSDRFSSGGFSGGGPSRILDDLARLATDAAGVAQGARREVETAMRAQIERLVAGMDLVGREEFEAVRDMAARARTENEALRERLEALEAAAKPGSSLGEPTVSGMTDEKSSARG